MEQHACATLAISVSPTRPLRRRSSHVRGDHTRAPGGRGWVRRPCSRCNPRARLHTPSLSFGVYSLPCFCWLSCSVLRSSLRPSSSATCPPHRTIFRHPATAGWPAEGLCRVPGSHQERSEITNTALCAHTTRARARGKKRLLRAPAEKQHGEEEQRSGEHARGGAAGQLSNWDPCRRRCLSAARTPPGDWVAEDHASAARRARRKVAPVTTHAQLLERRFWIPPSGLPRVLHMHRTSRLVSLLHSRGANLWCFRWARYVEGWSDRSGTVCAACA
ncbi:hypothetical protein HPB49_001996 [Dermacentor silvarum]|uniref:Uncharacterized protein n=1 Tax=Dermacentor silvarum TaxID=543639 RepID=A0ACB8DT73_DERSI|nr:hypothetical protein HPB49_001996 [Dermacentor silvarum]